MTTNGAEKEKANGGAGREKANGVGKDKTKKSGSGAARIKVGSQLKLLQDVIALMDEAQINEILFEQSGVKIHMRRGPGQAMEVFGAPSQVAPAPHTAPSQAVSAANPSPDLNPSPGVNADGTLTVTAPMVGSFYRSPAPDAKPYIQEGARLEVGQVFCIIEAMKLMNEIKSEVSGKVVKILPENGQAVEFGQPLLVLDPS